MAAALRNKQMTTADERLCMKIAQVTQSKKMPAGSKLRIRKAVRAEAGKLRRTG